MHRRSVRWQEEPATNPHGFGREAQQLGLRTHSVFGSGPYLEAAGVSKDITLADPEPGIDNELDAAYRASYCRYAGSIVDCITAAQFSFRYRAGTVMDGSVSGQAPARNYALTSAEVTRASRC